ncbi:MAG: aminotransferase class III-fold pyridoxal phosphate-dependent enzyme, partial [Flavihumibacter sp.]
CSGTSKPIINPLPLIQNVRGRGLMIGFDVPEQIKDLRQQLLWKHHIFTGEAKPNVVRLLPSLALSKADADRFLEALETTIATLSSSGTLIPS